MVRFGKKPNQTKPNQTGLADPWLTLVCRTLNKPVAAWTVFPSAIRETNALVFDLFISSPIFSVFSMHLSTRASAHLRVWAMITWSSAMARPHSLAGLSPTLMTFASSLFSTFRTTSAVVKMRKLPDSLEPWGTPRCITRLMTRLFPLSSMKLSRTLVSVTQITHVKCLDTFAFEQASMTASCLRDGQLEIHRLKTFTGKCSSNAHH